MHDVFIYPTAHSPRYLEWLGESRGGDDDAAGAAGFLIEVDANQVQTLAAHLKKFKLRARVRIRVVEAGEWGVWSAWGTKDDRLKMGSDLPTTTTFSSSLAAATDADTDTVADADADADAEISCPDRRAPGMGYRIILPRATATDIDKIRHRLRRAGEEVSVGSYHIRRILHGVAEGQAEIVRETALPLESNMDYMGGIDFRKGCYVGQELTIRTRHTGVVRKRILPVRLSSHRFVGDTGDKVGTTSPSSAPPPPPPLLKLEYHPASASALLELLPLPQPPRGANIARADGKGRSTGKWLAGVGNIGLALCRLEAMTEGPPDGTGFRIVWEEAVEGGRERERERDAAEGEGEGKAAEGEREAEGNRQEKPRELDLTGSISSKRMNEVQVQAFVPNWHRDRERGA